MYNGYILEELIRHLCTCVTCWLTLGCTVRGTDERFTGHCCLCKTGTIWPTWVVQVEELIRNLQDTGIHVYPADLLVCTGRGIDERFTGHWCTCITCWVTWVVQKGELLRELQDIDVHVSPADLPGLYRKGNCWEIYRILCTCFTCWLTWVVQVEELIRALVLFLGQRVQLSLLPRDQHSWQPESSWSRTSSHLNPSSEWTNRNRITNATAFTTITYKCT